jgi:hypothetical protein
MDKRHTFEDLKPPTSHHSSNHTSANNGQQDPNITALSTQDWLDTLSRAKDIAISQSATNNSSSAYSYSGADDVYNNLSSSEMSSHTNTLDGASELRSTGMAEGIGGMGDVGGIGLRGAERGFERIERSGERTNMRATLQKHHSSQDRGVGGDGDSVRSGGRGKRFSKRQSKGVLAAVF